MLTQWLVTGIALTTNFIIGLVVLLRNTRNATNVFFAVFTFFLGLYLLTNQVSLLETNSFLQLTWMRSVMYVGTILNLAFFLFVYHFPNAEYQIKKRLIPWIFVFSTIVVLITPTPLLFSGLDKTNNQPIPNIGMSLFMAQTISLLGGGIFLIIKRFRHSQGKIRAQIRLVLTGASIMFGSIVITNIIMVIFFKNSSLVGLLPIYTIIFTGFTSISIIKHRFLNSSFLIVRAITYFLLITLITTLYTILLLSLRLVVPSRYEMVSTVAITLIVVFSYGTIKKIVEQLTSKYLFIKTYSAPELLEQIGLILRSNILLNNLTTKSLEVIVKALQLNQGAIIIKRGDGPKVFVDKSQNTLKAIDENEIKMLCSAVGDEPIIVDDLDNTDFKGLLQKYQIGAIFLLSSNKVRFGAMLLGEKNSGEGYQSRDISTLEVIAYQLSIAINNSLAYEEIKAFNVTLKDEVERATKKLKAANIRLRELDALKNEFVSITSHELRTPLTSIRNYQWMLIAGKGGALTEKQSYYLERAYRATNRLTKLVTDMLNVSRIDSGRVLLFPEQVDLFELSQDIVEELQSKLGKRRLTIEHQRPNQKLPPVVIDKDKIYEVIMNLLANAIKFTPDDGTITISYVSEPRFITWTIEDTGTGIDPKYLDALFKKFSFVKNSIRSNHPKNESTGLGLYICKAIIELHGGQIWAKSAGLDRGATFAFTVPVYTPKLEKKMLSQYKRELDAGVLHNQFD